jgi:cellulose synthase/poly-beta-1,6-N-acetylglucosamine synthase-like glycosyltransferase
MELIYITFAALYGGLIIYFLIGILRVVTTHTKNHFTVAVLVPARDEEKNIINCLQSLREQTYHKNSYEVYVIDDQSSDNTAQIVKQFIVDLPHFHLLHHKVEKRKPTFKKQALQFALAKISSDIVMTIDADTVAKSQWIEEMVDQYDENTGMVAGLVTFLPEMEKAAIHRIQTLEFAGIVFCGVGAVGNGNPLICNGSNLSYRLSAFREVGGYTGNIQLPSGDDDLLMQNIYKKTKWQIKYSLLANTINYTRPLDTISEFLNQRARWASKSLYYPRQWVFFLMGSIYLYYLMLVILFPLSVLGYFSLKVYLAGMLLKIVPEAFIIIKALQIFQRKKLLKYFFVTQIFQLTYVLIVGFMGYFRQFTWKGNKSAG